MPAFVVGRRIPGRRESGGSSVHLRPLDLMGNEDLLAAFDRDEKDRIVVSIIMTAGSRDEFLERMDEVARRSRGGIVRQELFGWEA